MDRAKLSGMLQALASSLARMLALRVVLTGAIIVALALIAWRFSNEVGGLVGATAGIVIVVAGWTAALRAVINELARVRMLLAIAPDLCREALTEVTRWMAMSA
jgi:hypothetical protein